MVGKQVNTALPLTSGLLAKLPNLPLPRELRDKIYGYLLDGDYTRVRREYEQEECISAIRLNQPGPRAYHFHTNILAVNRAIHEESEELLYKRNVFVVVSYQWPSLNESRGGLYSVPVVSHTHAGRMKHHSIRLHISPGATLLKATKALSGAEIPVKSHIMLARDIDAFCYTVSVSATIAKTPFVCVVAQSDANVNLEGVHTRRQAKLGKPTQLKCEFRSTRYLSMDIVLQQRILGSLAVIISPSQRVVFTGNILDEAQTKATERIMSPTLTYLAAKWWSTLGCLILAKDVADACIEHDDICMVILQYTRIEYEINRLLEEHSQANLEPALVAALRILSLEIITNVLIIRLKRGLIRNFVDGFEKMCWNVEKTSEELGESLKVPDGLQAYIDNLRLMFDLYRPIASLRPGTRTVRDAVNSLTQGEPGPHQIHDAQILKRHINQDEIITSKHLPLNECSAVQLPFPGTAFYKSIASMKEQNRCRGWLDMHLVNALNDDQKQSIIRLQKRHGMKVTNFDEL